MKIRIKTKGLGRLKRRTGNTQRDRREMARAINRAAKIHYKRDVLPTIRKNLNRPTGYIKRYIRLGKRATASSLTVKLSVEKAKRPNLSEFSMRDTDRGVSYKISRRDGRKTISDAFVMNSKYDQGRQVFRRAGRNKLPIIQLKGVSVWGVVTENKLQPKFKKQLRARIRTETRKLTRKLTRGGR